MPLRAGEVARILLVGTWHRIMTFRLKTDDSAADGVHRIVKGQFRAALESLAARKPSEPAVHEARKRVKRIRAIVRLLRDELESGGARDEKHLRAAAHALSDLRDADATVETLKSLHG